MNIQNRKDKGKHKNNPKVLAVWLYACAFMVFAMTVIGAVTRLSESGLSMVEWRPLIGAIPPLNEQEWLKTFDLYKQSPQYKQVNFWMELEDFKRIFFWEWFHRLWGRLIGLVFTLPLIVFWIKGMIPKGYTPKLLALLALGAAQGFMGWYMVKSGLVDIPAVSHFRLAAHLGLALIIYALLLWTAFSMLNLQKHPARGLRYHTLVSLVALTCTIIWGAFTAGLDAGLVYNESFPKMGGQWLPPDIASAGAGVSPADFIHTPSGVQFIHRWLAVSTTLITLALWGHGMMKGKVFAALHAAGAMVVIQFSLGLITLFSQVNIISAAAHQAGALLLLTALILCLFRLGR